MEIKQICKQINEMPTMLAIIRIGGIPRLILSHASYNSARDEGTLTIYHGPLECGLGMTMIPDGVHDPATEWTASINFRGKDNGLSDTEAYLTEYDLIGEQNAYRGPEDYPLWAAKLWVKRMEMYIRKEGVEGKKARKLAKKIKKMDELNRIEDLTTRYEISEKKAMKMSMNKERRH